MTYFNGNQSSPSEPTVQPNIAALLGFTLALISIFTFDKLWPEVLAILFSSYGLKVAGRKKVQGDKRTGRAFAIVGLVLACTYLLMWCAYLLLGRL